MKDYIQQIVERVDMRKATPVLIFAMVVAVVINVWFFRVEYTAISEEMEKTHNQIRVTHWEIINGIIHEDYAAAAIESAETARRITEEISKQFPDKSAIKLHKELPINTENPRFGNLLKNSVRSKWLFGVKTDANTMFIATRNGVIMDVSSTGRFGNMDEIDSWDNIIESQANPELAKDALHHILERDNTLAFWEYNKSDNPNHKIITRDNLEELKEVYMTEGLDGLKNYEFLAPAYITETGDIFGVDDRDHHGQIVSNDKLIVVQGFSVYEQLMTRHTGLIKEIEYTNNEFIRTMNRVMFLRSCSVVGSSVLVFMVIIAMSVIYNMSPKCPRLCRDEEEEDEENN